MDISPTSMSSNAHKPPHRLFIGGLLPHTTTEILRPIFEQYGTVQHLHLVSDTQNLCRGYAFVDFCDPNSATIAITSLNGQTVNGITLKVQYSNVGSRSNTGAPLLLPAALLPAAPLLSSGGGGGTGNAGEFIFLILDDYYFYFLPTTLTIDFLYLLLLASRKLQGAAYSVEAAIAAARAMTNAPPVSMGGSMPPMLGMQQQQQHGVPMLSQHMPPSLSYPSQPPPTMLPPSQQGAGIVPTSTVIVLLNMVPLEELDDAQLYSELVQEISEECRKFGTLLSTVVPKEGGGKGKVYLQYEKMEHTAVAYRCLKGRKFGDAVVECDFYSEEKFGGGTYE
jgi:hypothetical protein